MVARVVDGWVGTVEVGAASGRQVGYGLTAAMAISGSRFVQNAIELAVAVVFLLVTGCSCSAQANRKMTGSRQEESIATGAAGESECGDAGVAFIGTGRSIRTGWVSPGPWAAGP